MALELEKSASIRISCAFSFPPDIFCEIFFFYSSCRRKTSSTTQGIVGPEESWIFSNRFFTNRVLSL
ncbi:hypothetical protein SUGI_0982620 [Cryptomeria japonica]|nr:hypothetical protein SUGI_0982620 [Cryptomeria japonica]